MQAKTEKKATDVAVNVGAAELIASKIAVFLQAEKNLLETIGAVGAALGINPALYSYDPRKKAFVLKPDILNKGKGG